MALGPDPDYVFLTAFEELDEGVAGFVSPPYEILIDFDGNQISPTDWFAKTTTQKLDIIYLTVAINKARKVLGLTSLNQIRYEKNTVNMNFTMSGSDWIVDGGATANPKLTLIAGKRYVISYPASDPLVISPLSDQGVYQGDEITTDTTARTVTIDTTASMGDWDKLYYRSTARSAGGEIEIEAPFEQYVPPTSNIEHNGVIHENVPDEATEFQAGLLIYEYSSFNPITVNDILVDLENGPLSPQLRTDEMDFKIKNLFYIPVDDKIRAGGTAGKIHQDISVFKDQVALGRVFVDNEDSIDENGNKTEYYPEEYQPESTMDILHADAFGPSIPPVDAEPELKTKIINCSKIWWEKMANNCFVYRIAFNPFTFTHNSIDVVPQIHIQKYIESHGVLEFTDSDDPGNEISLNGMFFDDIYTILNIRDAGYGIDPSTGFGGQDLSKLQKTRKCYIADDDGFLYEFSDAELSPIDQPKGSIYLGQDNIIATPNSYLAKRFDGVPRLDLFHFGSNNTDLSVNQGLLRRIYNDFTRLDWNNSGSQNTPADKFPTVPVSSDSEAVILSKILDLNLSWSSPADFESYVSDDHFKLRARDGSTKGPAIIKNSTSKHIYHRPQYIETTITSDALGINTSGGGSITRRYRVLASEWRLNIDQFHLNERMRWDVLDQYGYDLNPCPKGGHSSRSNVFFYTPPQVA